MAAVVAPIGAWTLLQQALTGLTGASEAAAVAAEAVAAALTRLTGASGAAAVAADAVAAAAASPYWVLGWPMVVLAAAALFARHKLEGLRQRFYFVDYVHANVE